MWCLLGWMVFSKFVKLITHFVRFPIDLFLWPVSILFGWFHGGIKLYALLTLGEVCHDFHVPLLLVTNDRYQTTWGSREGADADDKDRMIRQKKREDYFEANEKFHEKLPLHDAMRDHRPYDLKRNQALPA
jgi:hypothetical protein